MNKELLIVDDDLSFRERLTRSMEKKGFEVISSPGFKDSLSKIMENIGPYKKITKEINIKKNK